MTTNTIRIVIDSSGAVSGARAANNALNSVANNARATSGSLGGLNDAMRALRSAALVAGLGLVAKAMLDVMNTTQSLKAQLITATGSIEAANNAFLNLQDFAARTPFSLESATKAFVKLSNMGLEPTERALLSYGNTAGAVNKSITDMVEAVADAATGEFERLKDFGIKSKVEGDKLTFTFGTTRTTIGNNSREIQDYLIKLGETKFAGGAELQAKTMAGAFSTLMDNVKMAANAFGDGGFTAAVSDLIKLLTDGTNSSNLFATELGGLAGDAVNAFTDIIRGVTDTGFSLDGFLAGAVQDLRAAFFGLQAFGPILKDIFGPFLEVGWKVFKTLGKIVLDFTKDVLGTLINSIDFAINNFNKLSNLMDGGNRKTDYNTLKDFTDRFNARKSGLENEAAYQANQRAQNARDAKNNPLGAGYVAGNASSSSSKSDGDKEIKRQERLMAAYRDKVKSIEEENRLATLTTEEAERQRTLAEFNKAAAEAGVKIGSELYNIDLKRVEAAIAMGQAAEKAKKQAAFDEQLKNQMESVNLSGMTTREFENHRELIELINKAKKEGLSFDEASFKEWQKKRDLANDIASLQSKYNPNKQRAEEIANAQNALNQGVASGRINAADAKRINAEIEKDRLDLAFETNREARELERSKVYAIADLFGEEVGAAVRNIANALDQVAKREFTGAGVGGPLGKIANIFTAFTGGPGKEFAQTLGDSFKDVMTTPLGQVSKAAKELKNAFDPKQGGSAIKGIASGLGIAMAGYETGGAIASGLENLSKTLGLGLKISKTGGQIGGAIGSFVPIPFAKEIGSVLGAIIGGLFMRTPRASQTTSVDAYGQLVIGKAKGDKKQAEAVDKIAAATGDTLKAYQEALSADLKAGLKLGSIGARGDKYTYDTTGAGRTKGRGVLRFDSPDDAKNYAVKDAIRKGIFEGITDFSTRVLNSAKDMDRAVTLASKYEKIVSELSLIDDPISGPLRDLADSFKKLRMEMADNGATIEELAKVDRYYEIQRKDMIDAQLADLRSFKEMLNGEGSGVTAMSRFQSALDAFSKLESDVLAGRFVDQKAFVDSGTKAYDLARTIYGTASIEFQSLRERLNTATDSAISTTTRAQEAAAANAPVVNAIQVANDDSNKNFATLIDVIKANAIANYNGGGNNREFFNGIMSREK